MTSLPDSPTPYFTAFSHRFQTICRSCDGSTCTSTSPSSEEIVSRSGGDLHGGAELVAKTVEPGRRGSRRSGREFSRRAIDITFSMICRTRSPLVRTISVSRLSSSDSDADSPSSCAAWLMAPTGLRISCAMLADSRPSPASLDCWILAASSSVSSRNTMTGDRLRPAERCEMRLDDVAAVGGDEGLRAAAASPEVALPPGFEQIEQLRRRFAEQRARIGAAIAEQTPPRTR